MPGGMQSLRPFLRGIDVILEVADARLPATSRCPDLDKIVADRTRLLVLTRVDLADPGATSSWLEFFHRNAIVALAIDARKGEGVRELRRRLAGVALKKTRQLTRKGLRTQPLRVMVAGIPNVGKSSLLNRLAGRGAVRTGDRPGITRGPQWIRLLGDVELLDTPGVLQSRYREADATLRLGVIGCLPEGQVANTTMASWLGDFLLERHPHALAARYDINVNSQDRDQLLEAIGRRRGFLLPGGVVDQEKTAVALLQDFREGRLGRYTLEMP